MATPDTIHSSTQQQGGTSLEASMSPGLLADLEKIESMSDKDFSEAAHAELGTAGINQTERTPTAANIENSPAQAAYSEPQSPLDSSDTAGDDMALPTLTVVPVQHPSIPQAAERMPTLGNNHADAIAQETSVEAGTDLSSVVPSSDGEEGKMPAASEAGLEAALERVEQSEVVTFAGRAYSKGDIVTYTSEAGNTSEYYILTNTIEDPPGIVLQPVGPGMVFAVGGDVDPARVAPPTGEVDPPADEVDPPVDRTPDEEDPPADEVDPPVDRTPDEEDPPADEVDPPVDRTPDEEDPPIGAEPIVAHIADAEDTDRRAAKILADNQLNAELAELRQELYGTDEPPRGNRFSRMVKSVARAVKGTALHPVKSMEYVARSTMFREGYRQKYIHEHFGGMQGAEFHSAVADEVARRLDLGEDLLLDGEQILGEDRPEVRAVKDQLNNVFYQGITGAMDRASVLEEAKRIAAEAPWINNDTDQGPHLVQNLESIYDRVIAQVDHEAGLAAVDEAFKLEGGTAKLDVNAEAHRTKVDAVMEKLTNSRFKGLLVNEATTAIAVGAVASFVGNFLKSGSVRKGAILFGVVGAGFSLPVAVAAGAAAGGFALLRERMTLRQERALHMADIASGKEMPDSPENAPRRAEIDATIVEMVSASDLLQRFDELQPEDGLGLSPGDAQQLANWLVETTTLQNLGDSQRLDLVRYTSPDSVEVEKTDLFVARAQAISMVRDYALAHPDFMRAVPGADIDAKIASQVQLAEQALTEGQISERDKVFRGLMRKRGAQRAVATAAFSVFASYLGSKITDQISGGQESRTVTNTSVEENVRTPVSLRGDVVNMPKGFRADGHSLYDAKGNMVAKHFDGNQNGMGGFSPETVAELKAKGIGYHESIKWHESTVTRRVGLPEYMAERPGEFRAIHRTGWMDNNTPSPAFDLNELRLDFRANPDGSVVLASDRMADSGSFHDQLAIMAHSEQQGGNLRMLITPSRADQGRAITLDIQPNGQVVLPNGTVAREFFDIQPDGKVSFKGGFVEVAYPSQMRPDGSQGYFILATSPGTNQPIDVPIIDHVRYPVTTATLTVPKETTEVIAGNAWKAPFIPLAVPLPRRPLEKLMPIEPVVQPPGYYYGEGGIESARRWLDGRRNMHRPYKEIVLGDGGEARTVWVDEYGNEVERSVVRENETIDTYLQEVRNADPRYYAYLESFIGAGSIAEMDEQCRVSVNIPAWMEGKTIYRLLSQYVQQTNLDGSPIDPSLFEINIIVNRKSGAEADNSVQEIERFLADMRADGKNFKINYLDVEFDPPLNNVGHARKVLTDLTMLRSRQRPAQSGNLYIESEDADLLTIDPHVITNVINGFDSKPQLDVLRGRRNDRVPGLMMENDVLFASRRMWDFTERLLRRRSYRPDRNPDNWSYQWNRIYSNGWGTAYTAEAYAMIGGYDSHQVKGEDMLVGERITMLRGDGDYPNTEVVGIVNNRSSSSPRRFVHEVVSGEPSYGANFEDEEVNDIIRSSSLGEMMSKLSDYDRLSKPAAQAKMSGITAGYWEFIKNNTPNQTEAELVMSRLMAFMGFKKADYEITPGGGIKVLNYANLATALQKYRDNPPAKVSEEYDLIRADVESGTL